MSIMTLTKGYSLGHARLTRTMKETYRDKRIQPESKGTSYNWIELSEGSKHVTSQFEPHTSSIRQSISECLQHTEKSWRLWHITLLWVLMVSTLAVFLILHTLIALLHLLLWATLLGLFLLHRSMRLLLSLSHIIGGFIIRTWGVCLSTKLKNERSVIKKLLVKQLNQKKKI